MMDSLVIIKYFIWMHLAVGHPPRYYDSLSQEVFKQQKRHTESLSYYNIYLPGYEGSLIYECRSEVTYKNGVVEYYYNRVDKTQEGIVDCRCNLKPYKFTNDTITK